MDSYLGCVKCIIAIKDSAIWCDMIISYSEVNNVRFNLSITFKIIYLLTF